MIVKENTEQYEEEEIYNLPYDQYDKGWNSLSIKNFIEILSKEKPPIEMKSFYRYYSRLGIINRKFNTTYSVEEIAKIIELII